MGTWVSFGWVGMITLCLFSLFTYISANNRDIDTKFSAYDPWGLPPTSRMSWMTLGTWVSFGWVGMITIGLFSLFIYISANNRDIDMKFSGYDPWGLSSTSRMSLITLGTWVSFGWVGMITIGLFSLFS